MKAASAFMAVFRESATVQSHSPAYTFLIGRAGGDGAHVHPAEYLEALPPNFLMANACPE